jgi:hypothetical protein
LVSYYHQTNKVSCGNGKHSPTKLDKNSKMAQNINVRMPPFLPTVPLPVGMVGQGMMYMYSCSQCDFKTHVEAMFKQHVDSVHLGIPRYEIQSNSLNNVILSTGSIGTTTGTTLTVNPSGQLTTLAGQQLQIATTGSTGLSGLPQTVMLTQTSAPQQATQATVVAQKAVAGIQQPQPMVVQAAPGGITTVHKCPKCGFLAPSKNQLTQHRRKFHGKQTTYAPQVQGQIVANAVAATTTGTNASGKKTYTCSTCGYSTTRRDGLSQHYDSVHLKIKNHQCSLCPYAASQKGTLNRHVKLRHKKKDGAP